MYVFQVGITGFEFSRKWCIREYWQCSDYSLDTDEMSGEIVDLSKYPDLFSLSWITWVKAKLIIGNDNM